MKISYVILHYMAGKDTIECVQSILEISKASEHQITIIVVDNGSTNSSYKMIRNEFDNKEKVIVLHSDENLGFAKGNNIGFRYAKEKCKADFIVLLNNDTLISQDTFNEIIVKKYKEKAFGVLGPDIISADGFHQNPGSKQTWTQNELLIYRLKKRVRILLSYLHLDSFLSKLIETRKEIYRLETLEGDLENTILHGACLIFSPEYIRKFDGMYDKTFLYWEEDILKLQADYFGFLMLYSSELKVLHKEDVATNMAEPDVSKRTRNKYKRLISSSKIYSKLKKIYEKEN